MTENGVEADPSGSNHAGPDLLSYITKQTAGFYSFISQAAKTFKETGHLPTEVFLENGKLASAKHAPRDKPKEKRPMSAFNFFMKQKMEELKADDPVGVHKELFNQAVAAWKELGNDEKKHYTESYKAGLSKDAPEGVVAVVNEPAVVLDEPSPSADKIDKPPAPAPSTKAKAKAAPASSTAKKTTVKEKSKSKPEPKCKATEQKPKDDAAPVRESQRKKVLNPKFDISVSEDKKSAKPNRIKEEPKPEEKSEVKKKRKEGDAESQKKKKKKKKSTE